MQPISGTAEVIVPAGKKIEHLGIKVELIGQIGNGISSHRQYQ